MQVKANYVDLVNKKIFPASITIKASKIFSIIEVDEEFDSFILPGFIDAHIHIESSMLIPSEFAKLAVQHGTIATISDPHEIANVLGVEGVEFMIENASKVNFHFNFGVSPCVPATQFETSGASLGVDEVKKLLHNPKLNHLSEVMAFPSVLNDDEEMMQKIAAAKELNLPIDGHAPALSGADLQKYIDAGISTDHEASSYAEAKEKLERGMKILIREGSAAKNYEALADLIPEYYENLMFCSDDRHPNDLNREHINALVKRSIERGFDLFEVLQIASINPIKHYNLDVGYLQVGDSADFIEVKDLESFEILKTVIKGQVVFEDGRTLIESVDVEPINNFHAEVSKESDFLFQSECESIEVIQAIDKELLTKELIYHTNRGGFFSTNIDDDILKVAVINRYSKSEISLGFINGFGLKRGAIASSVAHDSHNIIVVGCSDKEMSAAVNLIIAEKGGICAVNDEEKLLLPLEVGGIMSREDGLKVAREYEKLDSFVKDKLDSDLSAPFMTLSFMALLVIPEIKLSDKGLFDGREFHFIRACRVEM